MTELVARTSWDSRPCRARYADYPEAFADWNRVSSIGAYIPAVALLVFLYGVFDAFRRHRLAGNNPWGAGATTLEWTLPSAAAVPHL